MGVTILVGETAFFLGNIPLFKHASRCFWWYHVYSAIQQIKIGTLVILTKISTTMIHHIQIIYVIHHIKFHGGPYSDIYPVPTDADRCSLRTQPSRSIARDLAPKMFTNMFPFFNGWFNIVFDTFHGGWTRPGSHEIVHVIGQGPSIYPCVRKEQAADRVFIYDNLAIHLLWSSLLYIITNILLL